MTNGIRALFVGRRGIFWQRFGYGMIFLLALALTAVFWDGIFEFAPFPLFILAVAITASFGGFLPGAIVTIASLSSVVLLEATHGHGPPLLTTGTVVGIACLVVCAIGEYRKRTEKKLIQSEQDLLYQSQATRTLVETSASCFFLQDANGVATFMNPAAERVTGYKLNEIRGKPLHDFIHYRHPNGTPYPVTDCELAKAFTEGRTFREYEDVFLRKDGSFFPVSCSVAPFLRDGRVSGCFLEFRDITDQKRAQEFTIRAKEEWERTFNSVPDAIAVVDPNYRILRVNEALAQEVGRSPEECVGRPCHEILHDCVAPPDFCPHTVTMHDGKTHSSEYRDETRGRDIHVTTTPLLGENGEMLGSVHITRDVTTRKQIENALKAAKDAADSANRAKSVFLANMSHEIRTPLNAIIGFSELLRDETLAQHERRDFVNIVVQNCHHLIDIINDILDLSKVEAGKIQIDMAPVSPQAVLDDIERTFASIGEKSQVSLFVRSSSALPRRILTDQTRIRQILVNLVGNAIKFTPPGGAVTLTAMHDPAKNEICFAIKDTGIGIPESAQQHIFDPFYQCDASVSRRFGGTGLGLSLSRKLARLLGGDVVLVESVPNKGSSFLVTIAGRTQDVFSRPTVEGLESGAEDKSLRGLNILVAEDHPDSQKLIANILHYQGAAEIHIASDGNEVIEKALATQPDIILMDLRMPRKDGLEATRELRKRGFAKPILALTAQVLPEEYQASLEAGCQAHVKKPIDSGELSRAIASWCKPPRDDSVLSLDRSAKNLPHSPS